MLRGVARIPKYYKTIFMQVFQESLRTQDIIEMINLINNLKVIVHPKLTFFVGCLKKSCRILATYQ